MYVSFGIFSRLYRSRFLEESTIIHFAELFEIYFVRHFTHLFTALNKKIVEFRINCLARFSEVCILSYFVQTLSVF